MILYRHTPNSTVTAGYSTNDAEAYTLRRDQKCLYIIKILYIDDLFVCFFTGGSELSSGSYPPVSDPGLDEHTGP